VHGGLIGRSGSVPVVQSRDSTSRIRQSCSANSVFTVKLGGKRSYGFIRAARKRAVLGVVACSIYQSEREHQIMHGGLDVALAEVVGDCLQQDMLMRVDAARNQLQIVAPIECLGILSRWLGLTSIATALIALIGRALYEK
jgi:hypothetical protein